MNRRSLLKGVGAISVASALPIALADSTDASYAEETALDPYQEYLNKPTTVDKHPFPSERIIHTGDKLAFSYGLPKELMFTSFPYDGSHFYKVELEGFDETWYVMTDSVLNMFSKNPTNGGVHDAFMKFTHQRKWLAHQYFDYVQGVAKPPVLKSGTFVRAKKIEPNGWTAYYE